MNPLRRLRVIFQAATTDIDDNPAFEKFDDSLSPNVRALRLGLEITDILVAMGVSVADVVSMALDVTDVYCTRKVQFDVTSTLLTASQDRGNDREPLTMVRHTNMRTPNNMTVQAVQELVREIHHGKVDIDDAENRLHAILEKPKKYPRWATVCGGALISAGVGVLYGASPVIISIMFLLGALVTYIMRILVHRRVPTFFAQIVAAIFITLIAGIVAWLDIHDSISWINNINPTLIIIGGIVMLVAGLAIVSAVQDAIDEFYVTANARLLRVVMMTIGIVAGVLIGLYFAKKSGIYIDVDPKYKPITGEWSFLGPIIISMGYALNMQSRPFAIGVAGAMGILGYALYGLVLTPGPLSIIVASGIAAAGVGAVSTLISRWWRTPSTALMTAGIIPLVPGLTLYNGLFQLVGNSASTTTFDQGVLTLFNAALIALAIASGVSFGHLLARPVRRTLVRARNAALPIAVANKEAK
jgi:uncharacterized membrane protein YjjP (DUF1212 family)